jgi:hypothetical protein
VSVRAWMGNPFKFASLATSVKPATKAERARVRGCRSARRAR